MEVSGQPRAPAAEIWWQLLSCLQDIWHTDSSVVRYVYVPVTRQGVTVTLCHCVLDTLSSRSGRGSSQYPPKYNVAAPWRRLRARSAAEREMASLKSLCDVIHRNYASVLYFQNMHIFTVQQVTCEHTFTFRPIRKWGLPCSDFHKKKIAHFDSITWRFVAPNFAKIGK